MAWPYPTVVGHEEHSTINRPVAPPSGTPVHESHQFAAAGEDDTRCMWCDCRPGLATSRYPCGATVPRETYCYTCQEVVA